MATAEFVLKIENGELGVEGKIPYYKCEKFPQITLNKNAVIKAMELNQYEQFEKQVDVHDDYFITYFLDLKEDGIINISYTTPVEGWDNLISEDLVAISLYSHAFPANLPDYIQDSICYFGKGFENYDIYKAYVDEETGLYAKGTKKLFGEIVNIIGIRKGTVKTYKRDKFCIIYREGCDCDSLCDSISIGESAFQYYNKIYPVRDMEQIDIVVLGNGDLGGAYIRNNLIVMGEPPAAMPVQEEAEMRTYQLFAHELGHVWFCKADVNSFEDWLNETGAEWSHMLFLLETGKEELFNRMMEWRYDEQHRMGEEIRPKDGHHPNTVHTSGTVLFHMIYERYGKEAVVKILQILSSMEQQNTDSFLARVEIEYSVEIAGFIRENLDEKIHGKK